MCWDTRKIPCFHLFIFQPKLPCIQCSPQAYRPISLSVSEPRFNTVWRATFFSSSWVGSDRAHFFPYHSFFFSFFFPSFILLFSFLFHPFLSFSNYFPHFPLPSFLPFFLSPILSPLLFFLLILFLSLLFLYFPSLFFFPFLLLFFSLFPPFVLFPWLLPPFSLLPLFFPSRPSIIFLSFLFYLFYLFTKGAAIRGH